MMLRVYLYRKSDEKPPDYAWQHGMGQKILAWAKEQPENRALTYYNISHSGQLVTVAVSDIQVGVDAEMRRAVSRRLADRVLSEKEQLYLLRAADYEMTFLQFWTLKESYGKALRTGLAYPLKQVEFAPQEAAGYGTWQRAACSDSKMSCFCMSGEDYVLSVCACAPDVQEPLVHVLQNTFFV